MGKVHKDDVIEHSPVCSYSFMGEDIGHRLLHLRLKDYWKKAVTFQMNDFKGNYLKSLQNVMHSWSMSPRKWWPTLHYLHTYTACNISPVLLWCSLMKSIYQTSHHPRILVKGEHMLHLLYSYITNHCSDTVNITSDLWYIHYSACNVLYCNLVYGSQLLRLYYFYHLSFWCHLMATSTNNKHFQIHFPSHCFNKVTNIFFGLQEASWKSLIIMVLYLARKSIWFSLMLLLNYY